MAKEAEHTRLKIESWASRIFRGALFALLLLILSLGLSSCIGVDADDQDDFGEESTPDKVNSSSREERGGIIQAPAIAVFHSPLMDTDDINFEHISIEQGLSQSSVHTILQDQYGYMWFGTLDGLNRYDGNEIRVYKHHAGYSGYVKEVHDTHDVCHHSSPRYRR